MKHIITGAIILFAAVTTIITGSTTFGLLMPFALVSFFDALNLLSQAVAPVVGALIASIIWIHNRLTALEQGQKSLDSSVFGQKRNELSQGVTGEVDELRREIEGLREEIKELKQILNKS